MIMQYWVVIYDPHIQHSYLQRVFQLLNVISLLADTVQIKNLKQISHEHCFRMTCNY